MPSLDAFLAERLQAVRYEPILLDSPVPLSELPTPALVLDRQAFERNLGKMQAHVDQHGLGLRSHTKMHKSPWVARQQLERGAIGVCCAKVSEAEVMAAAGVGPVLITSPVVTEDKLARVIRLAATSPGLQLVVDHQPAASRLNDLASDAGVTLGVLVDLDPGMGRTGIEPGAKALDLARHITEKCPALRLDGLQMYIGNCMHVAGFEKRQSKYAHLLAKGVACRELLEASGIDIGVFSGGGTGTYDIDPVIGALTDLQAGSYAFMDVEYREIGGQNGERFEDFEVALFVLATAISKPQDRLITMDAGIKCLATDTAWPEFKDVEGVKYHFGGDEHGIVSLDNPSRNIELGDRLKVITPHCDPTVNLFDYYHVLDGDEVTELWPISARGMSQ